MYIRLLEFRGEDAEFGEEEWVAAPVSKGDLVLIHGQVGPQREKEREREGGGVGSCAGQQG